MFNELKRNCTNLKKKIHIPREPVPLPYTWLYGHHGRSYSLQRYLKVTVVNQA